MVKICKKCGESKDEECFYKYNIRGKIEPRVVSRCKECDIKRVTENYKKKIQRGKNVGVENSILSDRDRNKYTIDGKLAKRCNRCKEIKSEDFFYVQRYGGVQGELSSLNHICKLCSSLAYQDNKERYRARREQHYQENKDRILKENALKRYEKKEENSRSKARYYQENKEIIKEKKRIERVEKRKEISDRRRKKDKERRASDPSFRFKTTLSSRIAGCLGGNKYGKKTNQILSFLGYSVDDLKIHLEGQFQEGMSWDNYGKPNGNFHAGWALEHKEPVCSFSFSSIEDDDFRKCWALSNLRPMWALENSQKIADDRKKSLRRGVQNTCQLKYNQNKQ